MDIPISPIVDPQLSSLTFGREAERLGRAVVDSPGSPSDLPALRAAARQFESYFIGYLLKVMGETVPEGLIPNNAGDHFKFFYEQEIGRLGAEAGGIGLAALIEEHVAQQLYSPPSEGGLKSPEEVSDTDSDTPKAQERSSDAG